MSITNGQLKEILSHYSDESLICIHNIDCVDSCEHIKLINIKYFDNDEYSVPYIILN